MNQTPQQLFCDNCGAAVRPGANYCGHCSAKLNQQQQFVSTQKTKVFTTPSILQSRYTIIQQLGSGGFGAVYKARDTRFKNRVVAIKEMISSANNPQDSKDEKEQFEHEAELLSELKHPSLPQIHDYFEELGRLYIVMEYIDGSTLESMLQKHKNLPPTLVFKWIREVCNVLKYLHNQNPPIIFRDLKPANIMLTNKKDQEIKLIDFGIARVFKAGQSKDTTAYGSTGYAAPEQYGKTQSTSATDVYALGATLHNLLTAQDPSQNPFQFSSVLDSKEPWTIATQNLIELMTKMKPEERILLDFVDLVLQKIGDVFPDDPDITIFKDAITIKPAKPQNTHPNSPGYVDINQLLNSTYYQPSANSNAGKPVQSGLVKFPRKNQSVDNNPVWFFFDRKADIDHYTGIKNQLKAAMRTSSIDYNVWENGDDMIPGTFILQEYQRRADQAKIFVPLLSFSSVADDKFIENIERYVYSQVVYGNKLNQTILPVRVTQTDLDTPGPNGVSIMGRTAMPFDFDKTLRKMKPSDREEAYYDIAVRIKQILEGNI